MEQRISFVTLGVADLTRSKAFYEALGWTPMPEKSPDIAFFQAGALVFGLYPLPLLAEDANLPARELDGHFSGIALAHNGRSEADVDAIFAQALGAGAKPLKLPEKVFWGGYSGYFADPDGHAWEVAYNPFATIAEDGSIRM